LTGKQFVSNYFLNQNKTFEIFHTTNKEKENILIISKLRNILTNFLEFETESFKVICKIKGFLFSINFWEQIKTECFAK